AGWAERTAALDLPSLQAEAIGPQEMGELGMGALAAVGRASANEPRLIVLRHEPASPARGELVLGLVGKGITFDAGGISIKPGERMQDMKGDMTGNTTIVATTTAITKLKLPIHIITIIT